MIIRTAKENDIDALAELLRQLFSIEKDFVPDSSRQKKGLRLLLTCDTARIFVAEADGAVVGMVSGQLLISTAEGKQSLLIEDMIVASQWRGRGIGKKLLQAASAWAKERNACRMQLLADLDNSRAFSFYERGGWKRTNLVCLRSYNSGKR